MEHSRSVANSFAFRIQSLQQGLRTMARLPSIRGIDRRGKNLSSDGRLTVQEIYNNLNTMIQLSEIYIVPAGFDPDRIDPHTGKPATPITTFDQIIVGRSPAKQVGEEVAEEVEIFEYREMASQLALAKTALNDLSASTSLRVPLISSHEVITCDNTNFSLKDPDDRHRLGLVFSVPFYDGKQQLAGLVSGVVRSEVLAAYLPDGDGAVILPAKGYTIGQFDRNMQASRSRGIIEGGQPDPGLIYSEVIPLDILDVRGKWSLWVGRPNSDFLESPSCRGATKVAYFQFAILVVTLTLVLAGFYGIQRKRQLVTERAAILDKKVKESVSVITAQQEQMAASARLAGLGEMAAGIAHEINNPLSIIRGNSERLMKRFRDREFQMDKIDGHLTTIAQTVDRIVKIIRGLQAISRDGKGDPFVPTSLKTLIEESIDLCSARFQRGGVNLTKSVPEKAPAIDCRPAQVAQVIVNLLNNAFDAVSANEGA